MVFINDYLHILVYYQCYYINVCNQNVMNHKKYYTYITFWRHTLYTDILFNYINVRNRNQNVMNNKEYYTDTSHFGDIPCTQVSILLINYINMCNQNVMNNK